MSDPTAQRSFKKQTIFFLKMVINFLINENSLIKLLILPREKCSLVYNKTD